MDEIKRRTFITGLGAAVSLAPGFAFAPAREGGENNPDLTKVNPEFLASPKEVHAWHVVKDSKGGPTMTGSPSSASTRAGVSPRRASSEITEPSERCSPTASCRATATTSSSMFRVVRIK